MSDFEFAPVNDTTRAFIVKTINANEREIAENGWPGLPEGWIPLREAPTVNAMIEEGVIRRHEVTKPRPTDPNRTITYTYLSLEN